MSRPDRIGPWADDLPPAERLARFRSLRALCQLFCGPDHRLVSALRRAEDDPGDAAAAEAWAELMGLPSIRRRRILANMGELLRTTPIREKRHG
jgi:hypothetical protein